MRHRICTPVFLLSLVFQRRVLLFHSKPNTKPTPPSPARRLRSRLGPCVTQVRYLQIWLIDIVHDAGPGQEARHGHDEAADHTVLLCHGPRGCAAQSSTTTPSNLGHSQPRQTRQTRQTRQLSPRISDTCSKTRVSCSVHVFRFFCFRSVLRHLALDVQMDGCIQ